MLMFNIFFGIKSLRPKLQSTPNNSIVSHNLLIISCLNLLSLNNCNIRGSEEHVEFHKDI